MADKTSDSGGRTQLEPWIGGAAVRRKHHSALLTLMVLLSTGCATPVGVTRLDEQAAHRELSVNVLSAGKPSSYSTQLLERTAVSERFKSDPEPVLAELNSGLGKTDE